MMVGELLNVSDLDCKYSMFRLIMNSNAIACITFFSYLNPLTKMWHLETTFLKISSSFLEYVKLVKLAMVQIIDSMENERYLFTLV